MKTRNVLIKFYLPETGYLRLSQIVGNPKADPPVPAIIPVSRATLYNMIKDGRFPAPVHPFGPKISCWPVESIRALFEHDGEV
jgi:prophage regulatory protein